MTVAETWAHVENRWQGRLQLVAGLIPPGASVLDLGAGAEGLRGLVSGPYTPADVVPRSPDCLDFSIDEGIFPEGRWDVVVASGVLEHTISPLTVLRAMRNVAPLGIVTYHPAPGGPTAERLAKGWLSHLTEMQLFGLFSRAGWRYGGRRQWERQHIYRVVAA